MWLKIKKSFVVNILLTIAALWVGYSSYLMADQALALYKEYKGQRQEVEALTKKKGELEAYIAELQSREAVEREAKSRFNLKLPGEEVVVVVPEKKVPEEDKFRTFWNITKTFFSKFFGL